MVHSQIPHDKFPNLVVYNVRLFLWAYRFMVKRGLEDVIKKAKLLIVNFSFNIPAGSDLLDSCAET